MKKKKRRHKRKKSINRRMDEVNNGAVTMMTMMIIILISAGSAPAAASRLQVSATPQTETGFGFGFGRRGWSDGKFPAKFVDVVVGSPSVDDARTHLAVISFAVDRRQRRHWEENLQREHVVCGRHLRFAPMDIGGNSSRPDAWWRNSTRQRSTSLWHLSCKQFLVVVC